MRPAHPTEQAIGIAYYVSGGDGIGGRLRTRVEDFQVEELERFETEPLDAAPGAYPHVVFRAQLRNWDTNDFAGALSDRLGISRERVSWAGTKDKRAVTTQLFSVNDVDPARIEAIDDDALSGATIDMLGRAGRSLQFGDLAGNQFAVTVRDANGADRMSEITADLQAFAVGKDTSIDSEDGTEAKIGVPNYFGQQRFGSKRPITHRVGLAIVRGNWREAVQTYVAEPFESESEATQKARRTAGDALDDGDAGRALAAIPHRLDYERSMLHTLEEQSGDDRYRNAIEAVPTSLQRLFVHAAQSFVFNRILSERLDRGLPFHKPVAGDVACFADTDAPDELALPAVDREQRVSERRVDSVAKHCKRGRAFVTAPLVGTDTQLADGVPGEIEREVLGDLDLSPASFALPDEWESTGTRRAILVTTTLSADRDPPTFQFALPKGSYATVVLREYCKIDPVNLG